MTADIEVDHSPAGSRITVRADLGVFTYTQRLTLWAGVDRLDVSTTIDGYDGADRLIRVRWPSDVRGGLPVHEVADAVIGRGFGFVEVDSERFPWTLDNPANTWFALASTARVLLHDDSGAPLGSRAIGVAELVYADWDEAGELGTPLAAALVRAGVTATSTIAGGPRYGDLEVDSNLPDIRIAVGGPERNSLVAEALAMDPAADRELRRQVAERGVAAVWVAPRASLREEWVPGADLRDLERLPLLVIAGADPSGDAKAVDALIADLEDFTVTATAPGGGEALPPGDAWDGRGFAVLNRGTPGCVVTSSGDLYMSLMRSCTGWPSGIWIDPPRRTTPDGSGFQLQRWSHTFEYAVVAGEGDWRDLGLPARGHEFNHPLTARVRGEGASPLLPRKTSLLAVEPAREVLLDALKPLGSPLARGGTTAGGPGARGRRPRARGERQAGAGPVARAGRVDGGRAGGRTGKARGVADTGRRGGTGGGADRLRGGHRPGHAPTGSRADGRPRGRRPRARPARPHPLLAAQLRARPTRQHARLRLPLPHGADRLRPPRHGDGPGQLGAHRHLDERHGGLRGAARLVRGARRTAVRARPRRVLAGRGDGDTTTGRRARPPLAHGPAVVRRSALRGRRRPRRARRSAHAARGWRAS